MKSITKQNDVTTSGRLDSPAVESLQKREFHTHSGSSYPSGDRPQMVDDEARTAEDPALTAGPKIVTELRDQQPPSVASTLTEDLLAADDQRSSNLPPLSIRANDEQSVGSLRQCDPHTHSGCSYSSKGNAYASDDDVYPTDDDAHTVDDPAPTTGPKIVCAINEIRDRQPATTTLTSADFDVLDELTEDLLVAAVKRSLNVPPLSLSPNDDQSSSVTRGDSITSPEMNVPWIEVPSVLDRLAGFDEVSSEIRNADPMYGDRLPPLPLCLAGPPGIEHMPPITRHADCMAPGHLASNVQLLTTVDSPRPSDGDCEPDDVQIERPMLSEKFRKCEKLCSDITAEDPKCFPEHLSPVTQHDVEETQLHPCESSAIEMSTPTVKSSVRIQSLDALADDGDLVPDKAAEGTDDLVSVSAEAKSDGDGPEPATTAVQVKSAATEKPRQGRRRSFLAALGRRLLKFGRTLCCCCCCGE